MTGLTLLLLLLQRMSRVTSVLVTSNFFFLLFFSSQDKIKKKRKKKRATCFHTSPAPLPPPFLFIQLHSKRWNDFLTYPCITISFPCIVTVFFLFIFLGLESHLFFSLIATISCLFFLIYCLSLLSHVLTHSLLSLDNKHNTNKNIIKKQKKHTVT